MTLQLRRVVADGLQMAVSRNGAVFAAVFLAVETLSLLLVLVASTSYIPVDLGAGIEPAGGIAVGSQLSELTGLAATMLVGVFSAVVTVPISIIAIRTFVAGATDTIPEGALFNDLGRASGRGLVAMLCYTATLFLIPFVTVLVLFGVVAAAGTTEIVSGWVAGVVGLVVGGGLIVAAVAVGVVVWLQFLFLLHEIGVRGQGVVDAFRGSWATVRGSRLELGVLALVLTSLRSGVSWAGSPTVEGGWTLLQSTTAAVSLIASAAIGVVTMAILARAYRDLRPEVDPDEPAERGEAHGTDATQGEPNPQ